MSRLKSALIREYEDDTEYQMQVHNPRNTVAVELHFRGEKMAKVAVIWILVMCKIYIPLVKLENIFLYCYTSKLWF